MRTPAALQNRRRLWAWRVGIGLGLALALGYAPYQLYRRSDWAHYFRLRAELAKLEQGNQKLAEENQRLRTELDSFGSGERDGTLPLSVIERIARDELGLVRPQEVVFQLDAQPRAALGSTVDPATSPSPRGGAR